MANRIALELIADANPMLKALNDAQRTLNKFTDAADQAGQAVGTGVNKALDTFMNFSKGGAAAAGILAGGFAAAASAAVALTASAGRQAEQLDKLSQKTGISMNTLQKWTVIMAENDFQAESLTTGMRTLSKQLTDARDPASKAAVAFEQMGLDIKDLSSTESVIRAVADRFKDMADGPEKARMAVELFGKSGLDMIPTLNRGSKALDESAAASERFAAVLRSYQVKALEAADDAMDRVGVAANALKNQLGAVFAPTVQKGADALAEVMGFLARMVREVDTALDTLAIRVTHLALAGKELVSVLFSKDALNTDAWKQALKNVELIDQEAAKLIQKRRDLADIPEVAAPEVQVTASTGLTAEQQRQEALGRKLLGIHLHQLTLIKAEQNAQEALGASVGKIAMQEFNDRNKAFGQMVMEQERVELLNQELSKPPNSGPFVDAIEKKEAAVRNLMNIMPELTREEAILLATENEIAANAAIDDSARAWQHRNDALEMAVDHAKAVDDAQQTLFASEHALFGASDAAREKRMELIAAEGALQRQMIEENILDEKKRVAAIENLEIELDTKRRQTIQQFPSFFEQQMQSVQQSNAFVLGQITTTWTSGLANAIVNGGNFAEQALKATQVALLQAVLNFGVQKLAALAVMASQELAIESTLAGSKMAIRTASDTEIVAADAAAAGATVGIWEGAGAAIIGTFGAITGAIATFFTATIIPLFVSVGEVIMGFLSAIAASLDISIFGAPFSIPVWAAVGLIAAAVGAISAFAFGAFAEGGIVTGPTMGMIGEAGSSEAVIPLNKRGAAFMSSLIGGGGGQSGPVTIITELDGRPIAKSVVNHMPSVLRLRGVPA